MEKKPADRTKDDAGKVNSIFTATFQAAELFHDDDSWNRDFAPAAMAMAMPGLREQRTTRQYCDVVFTGSDGVEAWAHRFVMSYRYSSCHALFTVVKESMTTEQERNAVGLPPIRAVVSDLQGQMIELLVDYAYDTPLHVHVGAHNVREVLKLAETISIIPIRDHCLKTLKENLEPESCVGTYHLASNGGYELLANAAYRFVLRNFNQVSRNAAQFLELTPEEMQTILEDRRLHVPSEVEDTFKAILKWISADETRRSYLARFLTLVRFARCTTAEFESVLIHPEVQADRDSLSVLNAIHQSLLQPSENVADVAGVDMSRKLWLEPRMPKDILFVYGGWTLSATNTMLTYNCRAQTWRTIIGNEYTTPRAYHGVAVIDSCIYFVGGFDGHNCYHSLVCFDVSLESWSPKANMEYERCYVSVAVLQGYIYAMGGFDGRRRTNTVERYEVKTNHWYRVSDMNDIRSDASAAAVCGRIYIVGGYTGRIVLDTVEYYEPSTDVWTRIATMSSPRSGLKVVAHEESLYIIGGYSGQEPLSSMVEFDVKRARFFELPSLPEARSSFAATILEGSIYIIGGFNGMVTVKAVEKYDIRARTWYTVPEIHTNRSASAACTVENVDNPAIWM